MSTARARVAASRPRSVPRARERRSRATRARASSSNAPSHADIVRARVDALLVAIDAEPDVQRFVAIAGPPGGGKSTFADDVCAGVNAASTGEDACVVVPMDGFHFPLAVLDARSDAEHARARRGAPFTFDADAFVRCVRELRARGCGDVPTFDHAIHDPVPGGCRVKRSHRVVLIEGNYLLLPDRPWVDLVEEKAYEETWFVDTDVDEAMRRIEARHVRVGRTPEEAKRRVESNDRLNANLVVEKCRGLADVLIPRAEMT